jgi:mono/diheme cytochrome c family protein/glucose/arabinose dehydrogenase
MMQRFSYLPLVILFFVSTISCKQSIEETPAPARPEKIDPNPSSAMLSPEESIKTMKLPAGYHLELVASEPMIEEPVAIVWDGNGIMYVAEMSSYMQDLQGTGEGLPTCKIKRLEDTDGDGKMDKSSIYIDSLILPRMMLALDDRLVVNETYTYNLYSYRDKNGDGKADEKTLVYHNENPIDANLEHQQTGLVWNIDNWIYVTTSPVRYRYKNGMLEADSLMGSPGGQWGLTHDNYGRLFYSSAGGEKPATNFQVNPVYGEMDFKEQRDSTFDEVWPIVATPDVQGGLQRLHADSTLNHFTASCGQSIFRGDRLPKSMQGDLFICEPVGRLIRRAKVSEKDGITILKNAYDKREFIASTDMNFRPINTATGPDGCLYIVDMYHGIIQESAWTQPDSYINPQIRRKNLDKNKNRGRIYRLVHDDYKAGPKPQLLIASNDELIGYLSHENGWWRDNAQKQLVMKNDQSVVPELKKIVLQQSSFVDKLKFWKAEPTALGRLHAMWTLEGLDAIDEEIVLYGLNDGDKEIKKAAIRLSEKFLAKDNQTILARLMKMKDEKDMGLKVQLALSLKYSNNRAVPNFLKEFLKANVENKFLAKSVSRSLLKTDESLAELRDNTKDMSVKDRDLVFEGANNFKQLCATCHGSDGKGVLSNLAPPLAGSPRVNGERSELINLVLHGLKGPIDNKKYPDVMPAQKGQSDQYIASVLSYIRSSFGNKAELIKSGDVKDVRSKTHDRQGAWTLEELGKSK